MVFGRWGDFVYTVRPVAAWACPRRLRLRVHVQASSCLLEERICLRQEEVVGGASNYHRQELPRSLAREVTVTRARWARPRAPRQVAVVHATRSCQFLPPRTQRIAAWAMAQRRRRARADERNCQRPLPRIKRVAQQRMVSPSPRPEANSCRQSSPTCALSCSYMPFRPKTPSTFFFSSAIEF